MFPTNLLWKKGKEKFDNLSLNLQKEKLTEVGPASRSSAQLALNSEFAKSAKSEFLESLRAPGHQILKLKKENSK